MPSQESFFAALGSLPAAVALLTALRWPDGVTCPHCGSAPWAATGAITDVVICPAIAVRRVAGPSCSPPGRPWLAVASPCPTGW
jgi:hypothetical protein